VLNEARIHDIGEALLCGNGWILIEGRRGRVFIVLRDGVFYLVYAERVERASSLDEAIDRAFRFLEPIRIVTEVGNSVAVSRRVRNEVDGRALAKVLMTLATCLRSF